MVDSSAGDTTATSAPSKDPVEVVTRGPQEGTANSGAVKPGEDAATAASPVRAARSGYRLRQAIWVLLAILATAALCAWLAQGLFERQARQADAQRLGVYRDLQANRVIEYLDKQSGSVRYLARQPLLPRAPAPAHSVYGYKDDSAAAVAPAGGGLALSIADAAFAADLTDLILVEAATGKILFARGPGFLDRQGLTLDPADAGDQQVLDAVRANTLSGDGIDDRSRPDTDFVRVQRFAAAAGGSDASLSAWYSAPFAKREGVVLLARSSFDKLLEHLQKSVVDPSPFSNEAPETRLLIGADYEGLNEALLRESLRTPVRIMAVTGDAGAPALAALRRLDVSGNPMTLAIVQSRRPFTDLLELTWPPLAAGLALIALLFGALAARGGRAGGVLPPRLANVVKALRQGDFSARTGLSGKQDHAGLGETIDLVLDERAAAINNASRENAELNASVVRIMESIGTIAATRDLTVRVPVTEDVTGAISDALNMLTEETGRALSEVGNVAQEVARASLEVKKKGDQAEQQVRREGDEVRLAVDEVARAASSISAATREAAVAEQEARKADASSLEASHTVRATANGVMKARELIRQAEKRVKRLGEHSQEIGQVVGIIESISERTGILALNTSLQAAAAGEAGRQFAGLADEVKRLSKSAGQATAQIGRMVSAIQSETAETVGAVGSAIGQVVEISGHVAKADEAMGTTRVEIEAVVTRIAALSSSVAEQADLSRQLQERASRITAANVQTLAELEAQSAETNRLVDCARSLIKAVDEFKTGPVE